MPFLEDIKIQALESKYYIPFEPLKCSSRVIGYILILKLENSLRVIWKEIKSLLRVSLLNSDSFLMSLKNEQSNRTKRNELKRFLIIHLLPRILNCREK